MIYTKQFSKVSEAYVVEKTVEVEWRGNNSEQSTGYRIEALRDENGNYSTRAYRELEVIVQPAEIRDSKQLDPVRESIWVAAHLPWTDRTSADGAIEQCLSLLES